MHYKFQKVKGEAHSKIKEVHALITKYLSLKMKKKNSFFVFTGHIFPCYISVLHVHIKEKQ